MITTFDGGNFKSLFDYFESDIKPFVASIDYKEQPLVITTADEKYYFDQSKETLIKEFKGKTEELGCGKIVVKSTYKKKSKTQPERIEIKVELTPDYQKDFEIILFDKDKDLNQKAIEVFMAKYIKKPFRYLENVVGVELNFNKIFYRQEMLHEVDDVLKKIEALDNKLKALETEFTL